MDRKLIAAFTFGLLAVSVANLLLSAGIVSLILTERTGAGAQLTDKGNFPGAWLTTGNSVSLDGMNNMTSVTNESKADMSAANATSTPVPAPTAGQVPVGLPAGGQFVPPSGQWPPAGDLSQYSGQAPPSGQISSGTGQMPASPGVLPSGSQQIPSGTGQIPSGTGQYVSGTGSMPDNTMQSLSAMGYIPVDITGLTGGQARATPTPKPSSSFINNFSSLWNQ